MALITKKPWTADELCRLPAGWRYEIDDGDLVIMSPAGGRHNYVVTRVATMLDNFVRAHNLGQVLTGETGVYTRRLPRQSLRGVDVAFFAGERGKRAARTPGFLEMPPDLAVEVEDPTESDLRRKVDEYLAAGVRSVWVIDPAAGTLTRHAPGQAPRVIGGADAVVDDPVLPGFSCRLGELLDPA